MPRDHHQELLRIAATISEPLEAAMSFNGNIELKRRNKSPFVDVLCRSIAGQQLSVKAAKTIWGRVLESAKGETLAQRISRARISSLRKCGLSASKSKAMKGIVSAHFDGYLNTRTLKRMTADERASHLTALWGVGQWTADMMNSFFFLEPDIWPEGDAAAVAMLKKLTPRRRDTTKTALAFAPFRTYLALHMWRYADNRPD